MPLYDCMMLLKPHVSKESIIQLISHVGKHVYRRNGVVTDLKSYRTVQLGYGIKKLDGRYYQGKLMQMTMMTPPSFNSELQYLNKEDRLLRWILVKHRDFKTGGELFNEDDGERDLQMLRSNIFDDDSEEDEDDDVEEEDEEN
ncbi:hypothetical protein QVD17_29742 [Tagetes erecta]|uniref:Ribosomal protein S6 n=1 Tax=Tagetes erecta TaxID=13708 RepID=A0AAD8K066_TARER|nr:hypothetical protein QVD17_29742 [Tagetes erecta]